MTPEVRAHWEKDLKDLHMIYEYDAHDEDGNPQKWRYEIWFQEEDRINYKIHGGPMAGRVNYQTCSFQCIRAGELWQCNWLEETGTTVSMVYDIPNNKITTFAAFSKGHWEHAKEAHGDKRNPQDFERWRGLARVGTQMERKMLTEQADVLEKFHGKGDLEPIERSWPTM
ncbi:phenol acid carboxylase [Earliella scabrosa]|nr:phenol acid carboxylase [Earliella scabrosa]